ncbi:MAG: pyrroline-5-carboxylate reductase [Deltaproteobacteria bacterium]|nr:MAG: pyrroline-5-carboxylate reductase [Deltaproteobacteria bacterium]
MNVAIIGAGNMGLAIAQSLTSKKLRIIVKPEQLALKCQMHPELNFVTDTNINDTHVILAIKPQSFDQLQTSGKALGVYSVMAGVPLEHLKTIDAQHYVRIMPNIAARYRKSASVLTGDEELKAYASELFSRLGKTFWVQSEHELNAASAIVGSAPAWLALLADAMSDGAVSAGLSRALSDELVQACFESTSSLLENCDPHTIKNKISSPAGTTIAGLRILEQKGIRSAFFEAVLASYEKNLNIKQ